jgi:hypothetical protein
MTETLVSTMEQHSHVEHGYAGHTWHHSYYTWLVYKDYTAYPWTVRFVEGKESVETGVFIPGEYRTNPYSVTQTEISHDHNGRGAATIESGDFILDEKLYPGIHPTASLVINETDPVYFATEGFKYPHTRDILGYTVGSTYYNVRYVVGDWWRYRHADLADDVVPPRETATYEQLALQKATSKLSTADLELGETLGEYRETIQMLRSPLSGLKKFLLDDRSRNYRLLIALMKKDKRQVARLTGRTGLASADAMASTWLELRYGLRPLVMLVQDVIERVNSQQVAMFDPDKIRSARSRLTFSDERWEWMETLFQGYPIIRSRAKVEDVYQATASVQYRQTAPATFLDSLGLTPRFLPEVAWQLTKLSFVWDWIFSIGPWLGTLRCNPDIEVLGNTVGIKHERKIYLTATEMRYKLNAWKGLPGVHDDHKGGDLMIKRTQYERKVDVDLSYLPHFTYGRVLDLYKAVDSLMLIWQFAKQLK